VVFLSILTMGVVVEEQIWLSKFVARTQGNSISQDCMSLVFVYAKY